MLVFVYVVNVYGEERRRKPSLRINKTEQTAASKSTDYVRTAFKEQAPSLEDPL